ncbi:peptidoglycan DD-metalloendopeptidase family protein [Buchnera aphidicola]|uniref:peptidoglycan DD-metalloendopeptidase family protein n=1 Tax=Buchnera aphidicola TaxID=9 RepID=UPI0021C41809|nr:peptidoglycan DD-metalloendopeptidase family protein [Buchnera aphidicola]
MINSKKYFYKKNEIFISNREYIISFKKNIFHIFYIIKNKDTLYSISKRFGYNYQELSKFNKIKKPYKIFVGQKIWIADISINNINHLNCTFFNFNNQLKKEYNSCKFFFEQPLNIEKFLKKNRLFTKICFFCNKKLNEKKYTQFQKKSIFFSNYWSWPIKNPKIQSFSRFRINNRHGIEISGFKGQPVLAAASGEVVYVDDYFENYGKLIIIKHKDNYLSIYGFNKSILVKQKDQVYKNQKIATMGMLNNNLAKLYFEIRYKGEPINPLNLLPILKNN